MKWINLEWVDQQGVRWSGKSPSYSTTGYRTQQTVVSALEHYRCIYRRTRSHAVPFSRRGLSCSASSWQVVFQPKLSSSSRAYLVNPPIDPSSPGVSVSYNGVIFVFFCSFFEFTASVCAAVFSVRKFFRVDAPPYRVTTLLCGCYYYFYTDVTLLPKWVTDLRQLFSIIFFNNFGFATKINKWVKTRFIYFFYSRRLEQNV